ncbi:MAG: UvrD-helicase domain-containing protein, partial [Desulfovibrionales bacterium]
MIPVDKNPLYALLDGTSLIEASAGTGKTYTITGLYVRLLLEEDLPVSRILVVTFTRAATEELKDRIRARISQTLKDFQANSSKDRFTRSLLQTCDHDRSIALLRRALAEFDLSSIHTIHGFCQRVLAENAFLCNAPFDAQVLPDQEETIMQIVRDFWRRRILALPETFLNHLLDDGLSPESLYDQIRAGLNHPLIRVLPKNQMEGTADMEREFSALFQRAREIWESASGEITAILLHSPDLKRNIFRIKTTQNRIDSLHSLFTTTPTVNKCLGLQCFTNSHIVYGTKKGCPVPEHPFFPIAEELFTLAARMKETYSRNKAVLQSKLLKTVRLELAREREKDNSMGYEDMLTRVYRALTLPHADRLIRAVQAMYSAALIDEFQDTDPLQFEIFRILFGSRPQILFLIGDPKQSIYSFRGADVFAYFAAARDCRTRLTLDTNYRSRPGLLKAVNALFSHRSNLPFGMKEITYTDVLPSPEMEEKSGAQPSLNFWYLEGDDKGKLNKPAARKLAAQAVAARIGKLIREQGTRAGDCAVLVRKNLEARLMRDELSRLAIPGVVYAAGSVFHTPEAEDLYLLFTAAADPSRVQ